MTFKDQVLKDFEQKAPLIFEHIWACIELGVPVPVIKISWDKRKDELEVKLASFAEKSPGVLGGGGIG